jgi:hypothetical protein
MSLSDSLKRGFFNRYHKKMPFFERLLKDSSHGFIALGNFIVNGFQSKIIFVHPHYPSRGSTLYKAALAINHTLSNKPRRKQNLAVYWEYATHRKEYHLLEALKDQTTVLNLHSRDISKVLVDKVHLDIFGYNTFVDAKSYEGKLVQKNDVNAIHDGQILQGPLSEIEEGFIYQILIDNRFSESLVLDIRVIFAGEALDFVYLKYRDIKERFKNTTVKTEVKPIKDIFNAQEIQLINHFCQTMHLDYGELDVLRNKDDGKIYIVDVNNTPQGPPANTDKEEGREAIRKVGLALRKIIKVKI